MPKQTCKSMILEIFNDETKTSMSFASVFDSVKSKFGYDKETYVKNAFKKLVDETVLSQVSGVGLNGSFKMNVLNKTSSVQSKSSAKTVSSSDDGYNGPHKAEYKAYI